MNLILPKGWVWIKLNNICFVQGGYAFKSKDYKEKGIPLLRISNITNGKVSFEQDTVFLNESLYNTLPEFSLFRDDIVIALSGATTGKYGLNDLDVPSLLNQRVGRIRFYNSSLVSFKYIFNYLEIIKNRILKDAYGAAQPNISTDEIAEFDIPLPPLPEQHRIVAKIEELFTKLDAGVEALKKIKVELKRYRQSVLKSAFEGKLTEEWRKKNKDKLEPASVLLEKIKEERKKKLGKKYKELSTIDTSNLPKLPEGWAWISVGVVADDIYRYPTFYGIEHLNKGIPVIRGEHILGDGRISHDWNNYWFVSKDISEKFPRTILKDGDLVMSVRGFVGKMGLVDDKLESAQISPNCLRISINRTIFYPKYVLFFYKSIIGQQNIRENINATTIETIKAGLFILSLIPLTSLPEQHKIIEEIERRFSVADAIEKTAEQSLIQAKRLRQSILKRAFEGKLVPQDLTDEPAEKLLERIKVEKEKQMSNRNNKKGKIAFRRQARNAKKSKE